MTNIYTFIQRCSVGHNKKVPQYSNVLSNVGQNPDAIFTSFDKDDPDNTFESDICLECKDGQGFI